MFRPVSTLAGKSRLGLSLAALAAAALLAVGGCANLNVRGDSFPDNSMSDLARRLRQVDGQAQSFAFSNKARQIDENLGVR